MALSPRALCTLTTCWLLACSTPTGTDDEATDTHAEHEGDGDHGTVADTDTDTDTGDGDGDLAGAECQPDAQDCPDDYKCLLRLGAEDWEFVCLPVQGDNAAGESCTHDGVIAGTDDCDQTSWCIGPFDPNGAPWSGLCYPLCVEDTCANEERCVGIGSLPVCAPICDPLIVGSCGAGEACIYRPPEGFVCFPQGAEGNGIGEPCPTGASCAAGLHCSQLVAGCNPDDYCCTDYCDTNDDANTCAAQDMGAACEAIGASDPNQAHVGACVIPS
jgi:hypothetical protein